MNDSHRQLIKERYENAVHEYVLAFYKDGDGKISKYEWIKACPCFEVADFMAEYGLDKLLKR